MNGASRERWAALCGAAGLGGDFAAWHDRLVQLYAEEHRRYHNLQHLSDCLGEFDRVKGAANDPVALELAIWFHDAVYKPRGSDNEERSADLARKCLSERPPLAKAVAELVLATKSHLPGNDRDSALLIDIDLAILGQSQARFDEYEEQIRQEYGWVPKIIFKRKRAAILREFLNRPRIYRTGLFFEQYEERARANIERSLAGLG